MSNSKFVIRAANEKNEIKTIKMKGKKNQGNKLRVLNKLTEGVFLVTTTIAFVSFERDLSMNTDS